MRRFARTGGKESLRREGKVTATESGRARKAGGEGPFTPLAPRQTQTEPTVRCHHAYKTSTTRTKKSEKARKQDHPPQPWAGPLMVKIVQQFFKTLNTAPASGPAIALLNVCFTSSDVDLFILKIAFNSTEAPAWIRGAGGGEGAPSLLLRVPPLRAPGARPAAR